MSGPQPPSATLSVGATYQNWRLEREIGRGGTGVVYLGRHQFTARRSAIKVIRPPPGSRADEGAIARFHIETELHVTLRHPNLPDFFDADLLPDGTAVLVLEYLDGRDLGDTMRCLGKMAVGDAMFVVSEVLRPLMVMHARGVHRDIKPPNIYLCRRPRFDSEGRLEKGRVRLLDFGIAKLKGRKGPTREHSIVGTLNYMSPEQVSEGPLDGRSDLYALGAVLYEMLSGRPLYSAKDAEKEWKELYLRHVSEPLPDLRLERRDLPDDVWRFMTRLLEKRPEDRFATTEDALGEAKELRARHLETSKVFREDVDDVVERIDALKVEGWNRPPFPVSNPLATLDGSSDRETPPAPDALSTPAPERPTMRRRGTFRLPPVGRTVEPWQQRIVEGVRALVQAPRCFRKPALLKLGAGGAVIEVLEMKGMSLIVADDVAVMARADRRLELSAFEPSPDPDKQVLIDGQVAVPRASLSQGAVLGVGGVRYRLTDLAVFDPRSPQASVRARRASGARLGWVHLATGLVHAQIDITAPLTLVGSLVACDLVVPDAPDVLAAVWIRGDGDLELVELDTSVMPYGDPIRKVKIVEGRAMVRLGAEHAIIAVDGAVAMAAGGLGRDDAAGLEGSAPSSGRSSQLPPPGATPPAAGPPFRRSTERMSAVATRQELRTPIMAGAPPPRPPITPVRGVERSSSSSQSFPAQRPPSPSPSQGTSPSRGVERSSSSSQSFPAQRPKNQTQPTTPSRGLPPAGGRASGVSSAGGRAALPMRPGEPEATSLDGLQVMASHSEGLFRPLQKTYALPAKPSFLLGSDPGCDIVISHSRIAPRHCEIARAPDGHYTFRDLSTTTGTFLNGARVGIGFLSERDAFDVGGGVTFRLVRGVSPDDRGDGSVGRLFRKLGLNKGDPET